MKIKLFIAMFLVSFLGKSQEITVFYKEKRRPAQVSTKQSFDNDELTKLYKEKFAEIKEAIKSGVSKDSIIKIREELIKEGNRIAERINEREKSKRPLTIPYYDYITILKINHQKSLYYPQDKVSNDTVSHSRTNKQGRELVDERINYNDSEIIYLDTSIKKKISSLKVHKFDFRGRKFLIDEALVIQKWELTKETKQIDKYLCYKAILLNSDKRVEAWYTNEIKAPFGPKGYYGLPGLILELKEDRQRVRFDKIYLFPSEPVIVNPPTEGEKITREELENLSAKIFNEY
ncbi:GLPGLI family protein [Aquimarina litoralis]|uniref:GLPGLI family protein n=1 Tax=Aquimarina litoralis TaxID=584605 RepID=UPI001C588576|nr:GLPGLI family protein [Aquimarina litoralis]MBW1295932.1 GLPGLI family protein [Aquimarina litoralis]